MVGSRQNSARFQIIISWNSKSFMKMEAGFSRNLLACRCVPYPFKMKLFEVNEAHVISTYICIIYPK